MTNAPSTGDKRTRVNLRLDKETLAAIDERLGRESRATPKSKTEGWPND